MSNSYEVRQGNTLVFEKGRFKYAVREALRWDNAVIVYNGETIWDSNESYEYKVFQGETDLGAFNDLSKAIAEARKWAGSSVQIDTTQIRVVWEFGDHVYSVYQNENHLEDFDSRNSAIEEAKKWADSTVRSGGEILWRWGDHLHRVFQGDNLLENFNDYDKARLEAKKWAGSSVWHGGRAIWRFEDHVFEVFQGTNHLKNLWNLEDAIEEAKKWKGSIVYLKGQVQWEWGDHLYVVFQGNTELPSFDNLDDAITEAKKWDGSTIVHQGEVVWSYDEDMYIVFQNETRLGAYDSREDAIEEAKKWEHSVVKKNDEIVWRFGDHLYQVFQGEEVLDFLPTLEEAIEEAKKWKGSHIEFEGEIVWRFDDLYRLFQNTTHLGDFMDFDEAKAEGMKWAGSVIYKADRVVWRFDDPVNHGLNPVAPGVGGDRNFNRKRREWYYPNFSGTDMVATIVFPQAQPIVLGEVSTISYSIYREKHPVRTLGFINTRGFTKGPRTVAGTIIFTVFNRHIVNKIRSEISYLSNMVKMKADELPPFDIYLTMGNEYGASAKMNLYGITVVDEGKTMSVEDMFTENQWSYMARDVMIMDNIGSEQDREIMAQFNRGELIGKFTIDGLVSDNAFLKMKEELARMKADADAAVLAAREANRKKYEVTPEDWNYNPDDDWTFPSSMGDIFRENLDNIKPPIFRPYSESDEPQTEGGRVVVIQVEPRNLSNLANSDIAIYVYCQGTDGKTLVTSHGAITNKGILGPRGLIAEIPGYFLETTAAQPKVVVSVQERVPSDARSTVFVCDNRRIELGGALDGQNKGQPIKFLWAPEGEDGKSGAALNIPAQTVTVSNERGGSIIEIAGLCPRTANVDTFKDPPRGNGLRHGFANGSSVSDMRTEFVSTRPPGSLFVGGQTTPNPTAFVRIQGAAIDPGLAPQLEVRGDIGIFISGNFAGANSFVRVSGTESNSNVVDIKRDLGRFKNQCRGAFRVGLFEGTGITVNLVNNLPLFQKSSIWDFRKAPFLYGILEAINKEAAKNNEQRVGLSNVTIEINNFRIENKSTGSVADNVTIANQSLTIKLKPLKMTSRRPSIIGSIGSSLSRVVNGVFR